MTFLLFLFGVCLGLLFGKRIFVDGRIHYWMERCALAEKEMLRRQELHNQLRHDFENYIIKLRQDMNNLKRVQADNIPPEEGTRQHYMRGLYNGIELVSATVEQREVKYL